jgi:hypothetical protein
LAKYFAAVLSDAARFGQRVFMTGCSGRAAARTRRTFNAVVLAHGIVRDQNCIKPATPRQTRVSEFVNSSLAFPHVLIFSASLRRCFCLLCLASADIGQSLGIETRNDNKQC